jgi:glycosyltransferase EpsH
MKLYRTEVACKGRIVSERVVGTSEDTIFNLYALENCRISYINRCFYHYRKTNAQSITTAHKPDLADKWDIMYSVIQEYIDGSGKVQEYHTPFLNRVACGMIGLGLNEVGSKENLWKKASKIRSILNKPLYREAFHQLDISCCGMKWKAFFLLCKTRAAFLLTLVLQTMNYLRSRVAA